MNSRKLAGASAASVGAATAVAALLLGTLSGAAGEDERDKKEKITASAFGIAADGLLDIDPTPYVEAPPDERKALLEVPGPNKDGLHIALLKVEAEHFRSKATALKVDVLDLKLKVLEAKCENGKGDSTIISADGDGSSSPYKGQELDLSPVVRVEFNRQHRDHDKLTVDAAVIELLPGDRFGRTISQKDLDLLKSLKPNLKVPTMAEMKADNPSKPPTVKDLAEKLKSLNPNLVPKANGDDDALLEIVISSASCKEERRKREEKKEEAPPPKPVEAELPVTH
ncbi:MAG: hypothetical protein M3460_21810 [Actinomycetota bacterium]|nr:hypothetical protein [Actinomycetota bacterium]